MGPRNAYKDMLDNMVSPITCVSMNHQNQLQQMTNKAMLATQNSLGINVGCHAIRGAGLCPPGSAPGLRVCDAAETDPD
jgi:hypothetical protein